MKPIKLSGIIPSRNRTPGLLAAIENLRATQGPHDLEIVVVLDESDAESHAAMAARSDVKVVTVGDDCLGFSQRKYQIGYRACRPESEWIFTFADDCLMNNPNWIDACLKVNRGGYVGFYDEVHPPDSFATMQMAHRGYIETVMKGRVGLEWYRAVWADFEWSMRAKRLGVFVICTEATFTHNHWVYGKAEKDLVYQKGEDAEPIDRRTQDLRMAAGYPDPWP